MSDVLARYRQFLFGLFTGLGSVAVILLVARQPAGKPVTLIPPEPTATARPLRVYVTGAVYTPGVYEFEPGEIVQAALEAAGGAAPDGTTDGLNLAAPLYDGQQIIVPLKGATPPATAAAAVGAAPPLPTAQPAGPIDINTASAAELESLPRIGPVTAQKIVEYREQHGPFQRIEDIKRVSGIGDATFEAIQALIVVR